MEHKIERQRRGYQPDGKLTITGSVTLYAIYTDGSDASHRLAIRTLDKLKAVNDSTENLGKHYKLMNYTNLSAYGEWTPSATAKRRLPATLAAEGKLSKTSE